MTEDQKLIERLRERLILAEQHGPIVEGREVYIRSSDLRDVVALADRLEASLRERPNLRPITMQDVRLATGEGKLSLADVLAGCNAELQRRSRAPAAPSDGGE